MVASLQDISSLLYTAPERFSYYEAEGRCLDMFNKVNEAIADQSGLRGRLASRPYHKFPSVTERTIRYSAGFGSDRNLTVTASAGSPPPQIASMTGPFASISNMKFEIMDEIETAKRRALKIRATPRAVISDFRDHALWCGADEYELIIDAERGVCLGLTQFYKGEELSREEICRIEFSAPLPNRHSRWESISDIVRLLHGSRDRFTNLHAVSESWHYDEQVSYVEEGFHERDNPEYLGRLTDAMVDSQSTSGADADMEPVRVIIEKTGKMVLSRHRKSVWVKKPHKFRAESHKKRRQWERSYIIAGATWWDHTAHNNTIYTNAHKEDVDSPNVIPDTGSNYTPLYCDVNDAIASQLWLDSSWILSTCWIEPQRRSRLADRDSIQFRTIPVERVEWNPWLSGECDISLDPKYGIILKMETHENNALSSSLRLNYVSVDEPIDYDTFTFDPKGADVIIVVDN